MLDYFDPFDYLNVLFDGSKIQASNNNDYSYFNNAAFNKQLASASQLSGTARAAAYAKLDSELMVDYAPVVPYLVSDEPVLRLLADEELDLQLVLRLALPERSGGRLAVTHVIRLNAWRGALRRLSSPSRRLSFEFTRTD